MNEGLLEKNGKLQSWVMKRPKMSLKHLVVQESKEPFKIWWNYVTVTQKSAQVHFHWSD